MCPSNEFPTITFCIPLLGWQNSRNDLLTEITGCYGKAYMDRLLDICCKDCVWVWLVATVLFPSWALFMPTLYLPSPTFFSTFCSNSLIYCRRPASLTPFTLSAINTPSSFFASSFLKQFPRTFMPVTIFPFHLLPQTFTPRQISSIQSSSYCFLQILPQLHIWLVPFTSLSLSPLTWELTSPPTVVTSIISTPILTFSISKLRHHSPPQNWVVQGKCL